MLRNPASHREVEFDDVTEASEAVMLASLLMRMLDRVEARLALKRPWHKAYGYIKPSFILTSRGYRLPA